MFGIYTKFILSSKYPFNIKNTIPYFIMLICNRFNFAILWYSVDLRITKNHNQRNIVYIYQKNIIIWCTFIQLTVGIFYKQLSHLKIQLICTSPFCIQIIYENSQLENCRRKFSEKKVRCIQYLVKNDNV